MSAIKPSNHTLVNRSQQLGLALLTIVLGVALLPNIGHAQISGGGGNDPVDPPLPPPPPEVPCCLPSGVCALMTADDCHNHGGTLTHSCGNIECCRHDHCQSMSRCECQATGGSTHKCNTDPVLACQGGACAEITNICGVPEEALLQCDNNSIDDPCAGAGGVTVSSGITPPPPPPTNQIPWHCCLAVEPFCINVPLGENATEYCVAHGSSSIANQGSCGSPTGGACCYGNDECLNTSECHCAELAGIWNGQQDCTVAECAEVIITKVPDYLFASTTYATPIRFVFTGQEPNPFNVVTVLLKVGSTLQGAFDVTHRIREQQPATAFVRASDLWSVNLPDDISSDAHFEISVTTPSGKTYDSDPNTPAAAIIKFADRDIFALDMGTLQDPIDVDIDMQSDVVSLDDWWSYTHTKHSNNIGPHNSLGMPHEDQYANAALMAGCNCAFDIVSNSVTEEPLRYSAFTRLSDDLDLTGSGGEAFKARNYGFRRGGHFFLSYGRMNPDPPMLDPGEHAMNIFINHGFVTIDAWDGALGRLTIVTENAGGINLDVAASGFALAAALNTPPPWDMVFGVTAALISLYDAVDGDELPGGAGATACVSSARVRTMVSGQSTPVMDQRCRDAEGGAGFTFSLSPSVQDNPTFVGDQWAVMFDLVSASEAESLPPLPWAWSGIEVSARAEFFVTDPQEFQTFNVIVRQ